LRIEGSDRECMLHSNCVIDTGKAFPTSGCESTALYPGYSR
jgi:hypothetical protein